MSTTAGNLGTIKSATINGTYDAALTQCAGITLTAGTYLVVGNIVSSGLCRDMHLLLGGTEINRSYAGDNTSNGVENIFAPIAVSAQADLTMKIQMATSVTVTGKLQAIRLK